MFRPWRYQDNFDYKLYVLLICSAEDNVHEYDYDEIRILLIIRMYFDDYNIGYEVTIYDYEYAWDLCDKF